MYQLKCHPGCLYPFLECLDSSPGSLHCMSCQCDGKQQVLAQPAIYLGTWVEFLAPDFDLSPLNSLGIWEQTGGQEISVSVFLKLKKKKEKLKGPTKCVFITTT